MSYSDLLKDPRWQRKRLEVLERAEWRCEECDDASTTLHVHHTYYAKGKKPWDYPGDALRCLCEPCHKRVTDVLAEIQRLLGASSQSVVDIVLGFVRATAAYDYSLPVRAENAEVVLGIARAYRMSEQDAMALLDHEKKEIPTLGLFAGYRSSQNAAQRDCVRMKGVEITLSEDEQHLYLDAKTEPNSLVTIGDIVRPHRSALIAILTSVKHDKPVEPASHG